jgi:two-component system, cell cycle response regulator DivK
MSKRILVVEDQPDNRQIIRDMLADTGYEIAEAENGEEALAAIAKQRPDLILMDIQLPVMDGYAATRRIKTDPALKSIPVIAVTSYALSGEEKKAREAGCDDYVPKPYSPRQLLAKIRQYLTQCVIASEAKQSKLYLLDCFVAPVGAPRNDEIDRIQVLRLDRQHRAAYHAAGAEVLKRRLRLIERPRLHRYRGDFARTRQREEFARLRQGTGQSALDGNRFDCDHGGRDGEAAAKEPGDNDLAAARQNSGRELQRFIRANKVADCV